MQCRYHQIYLNGIQVFKIGLAIKVMKSTSTIKNLEFFDNRVFEQFLFTSFERESVYFFNL